MEYKKFSLSFQCLEHRNILVNLFETLNKTKAHVIECKQFTDKESSTFFLSIQFEINTKLAKEHYMHNEFKSFFTKYSIHAKLKDLSLKNHVALFVSKESHCLLDLINRVEKNHLPIEIKLIISNHLNLKELADQHNIPFHQIPITEKPEKTNSLLVKLHQKYQIDYFIESHYLGTLPPSFYKNFYEKIILIHPKEDFLRKNESYLKALNKGEKFITGTTYFHKEPLMQSPIIYQKIDFIKSNTDDQSLKIHIKELECKLLIKTMSILCQNKLFINKNRTLLL